MGFLFGFCLTQLPHTIFAELIEPHFTNITAKMSDSDDSFDKVSDSVYFPTTSNSSLSIISPRTVVMMMTKKKKKLMKKNQKAKISTMMMMKTMTTKTRMKKMKIRMSRLDMTVINVRKRILAKRNEKNHAMVDSSWKRPKLTVKSKTMKSGKKVPNRTLSTTKWTTATNRIAINIADCK